MPDPIAIVGAGAWGMALAHHLARAGHPVRLWGRTRPAQPFPAPIEFALDLPAAPLTLLAVPTQHLRAVAGPLPPGGVLVACCKGVEQHTGRLPLEILADLHPGRPAAILTGPTFAHDIAAGRPAAALIAAGDASLRARLITQLATANLRLYGSADPLGAQLGGAAKNVIAIAAGCVAGAGLGDSARAGLVTRGVAELARLITALGGRPETAAGLSGLGDLVLTCTSLASRNLQLGTALGRGVPLDEALAALPGVAEGATTAPALLERAAGLDLPICTAVARLLAGQITLPDAIAALLARPPRDE